MKASLGILWVAQPGFTGRSQSQTQQTDSKKHSKDGVILGVENILRRLYWFSLYRFYFINE
jgi:hypothetical protein